MDEADADAEELYDKITKEIKETAAGRCLEIDLRFSRQCVPNAPSKDISKEELSHIEYLNSVRDARLRLEVQVLRLEVQIKQQKLAAREFAHSEAQCKRTLATEMKDYLRMAQDCHDRQRHRMSLANKEVDIEMRLAHCQKALSHSQSEMSAASQRSMDVTSEILRRVKCSTETLTQLMELEGHQSVASLAAATKAMESEAASVERELVELGRQVAAMEAALPSVPA